MTEVVVSDEMGEILTGNLDERIVYYILSQTLQKARTRETCCCCVLIDLYNFLPSAERDPLSGFKGPASKCYTRGDSWYMQGHPPKQDTRLQLMQFTCCTRSCMSELQLQPLLAAFIPCTRSGTYTSKSLITTAHLR